MDGITIVTAFFDANRGNMKTYSRSNEKYIEYFKFWAHIQNNIVVYSDKKTINEVIKIRKGYGLLKETHTVIVDEDYINIDIELFESMNRVMSNKQFLDFHIQRDIPEATSVRYNFIMAIKSWCCKDAVERGYAKGMVAWLDFGFNYGGRYYRKESEFDFLWEFDFSNHIHLLRVHEFDNLLPFEIIRQNNSYIQGGEIVAPDYLWDKLYNMVRNNMLSLNRAGLCDDDQLLYLMSYWQNPELFIIHDSEWLSLFRDFGNKEFTFIPPKDNKVRLLLRKIKHPSQIHWLRKLTYSIRTFIYLVKEKQRC